MLLIREIQQDILKTKRNDIAFSTCLLAPHQNLFGSDLAIKIVYGDYY